MHEHHGHRINRIERLRSPERLERLEVERVVDFSFFLYEDPKILYGELPGVGGLLVVQYRQLRLLMVSAATCACASPRATARSRA